MRKTSVEARRNEILEATGEVVIERGFAATRVADVAQRLGLSTGLIHYHFESKDHLLAEAFEHAAKADLARLDEELARPGTAAEQLDRVFRLTFPHDDDPSWLIWIDGWGEASRSPALRAISQRLDLAWQQRLEEVISKGVAAGELHCDDPRATAWRLAALIDGLSVQRMVHEGVVSKAELARWVNDAACRELGLPPDTFDRRPRTNRKVSRAAAAR